MEAWPDGVSYVNYIMCEACHLDMGGHISSDSSFSSDDDNPWAGRLE